MRREREQDLETRLREEVRKQLSARRPAGGAWSADEVRRALSETAERLGAESRPSERTIDSVFADLVGLGPLDELLLRKDVQEILVNGPDEIFVESSGRLVPAQRRFRDKEHLQVVLERLLAIAGETVHDLKPHAEGSLPDGSRFHLVVPPMAPRGPLLTIRRFPARRLTMAELTGECRTLPLPLARFLELAVKNRTSLLIAGAAGVGKTTLLNALAESIPAGERVVSLESTAELKLERANWASLESAGPEAGAGLRDLLRHALRMRPDRLLIGECLGAEAFDLLQAMNTGHAGCMTTLHANSPADAVDRLLSLAMAAGVAIPSESIGKQIATHLKMIVQLERAGDGTRQLTRVASVRAGALGRPVTLDLARRIGEAWEIARSEDAFPADWPAEEKQAALALLGELV